MPKPVEPIPRGGLSPMVRGWLISAAIAAYVVVGGLALLFMPDQLLSHWFPDMEEKERAAFLGSAAQVVLLGLGGVIAVAGVGLSLARHAEELHAANLDRSRAALQARVHKFERTKETRRRAEAALQRSADAERALRGRFVAAVELLTATEAMMRMAGLYAFAALADDWIAFHRRDEAQVCIDVLCGYLRSPMAVAGEAVKPDEAALRQSGYEIVRSRLAPAPVDAVPPWSGFVLNLRDAVFQSTVDLSDVALGADSVLDLSGARLESESALILDRAHLCGNGAVKLDRMAVGGAGVISLAEVRLSDTAAIASNGLTLRGSARLQATHLHVGDHADVTLQGSMANDAKVFLIGATVSGSARIRVATALADRSSIGANQISVRDFGRLDLADVRATGEAYVRVSHSGVEDRGEIWLQHATLAYDGFEYAEHLDETEAGVKVRRGIVSVDKKSSFAPNTVLGSKDLASERDEPAGY